MEKDADLHMYRTFQLWCCTYAGGAPSTGRRSLALHVKDLFVRQRLRRQFLCGRKRETYFMHWSALLIQILAAFYRIIHSKHSW